MKDSVKRRIEAIERSIAASGPLGPVKFFMQQDIGGAFTCDGRFFATEKAAKAAYPEVETFIFLEVVDGRRKHNTTDEENQ